MSNWVLLQISLYFSLSVVLCPPMAYIFSLNRLLYHHSTSFWVCLFFCFPALLFYKIFFLFLFLLYGTRVQTVLVILLFVHELALSSTVFYISFFMLSFHVLHSIFLTNLIFMAYTCVIFLHCCTSFNIWQIFHCFHFTVFNIPLFDSFIWSKQNYIFVS